MRLRVVPMISGPVALVGFTLFNIGVNPIIMGVIFSAIAYVLLTLMTLPLPDSYVDAFMERIGRRQEAHGKTGRTVTT